MNYLVLSRTQLLLAKISQVVQDVCDINKSIRSRKTSPNNLSMSRDLPCKHKINLHNNEQSDEGYKYFEDSKNTPQCQDLLDKPCNQEHCGKVPPSSLPVPVPKLPAPETTHAYPEAWLRSISGSSSLAEPCSEGNISDPSSSCNSSLSDSPSEEMDSREGMDKEEEGHPDLDGGGGMGMVGELLSGEGLRGEGLLPIQQVQGWEWKKDR